MLLKKRVLIVLLTLVVISAAMALIFLYPVFTGLVGQDVPDDNYGFSENNLIDDRTGVDIDGVNDKDDNGIGDDKNESDNETGKVVPSGGSSGGSSGGGGGSGDGYT